MLIRMLSRIVRLVLPAAAFTALAVLPVLDAQTRAPQPPKSVRLYVLDCGVITGVNASGFGFQDGDLATSDMVTPCFLIVHPRGALMWDTGEIPDSAVKTDGTPTRQGVFTVTRPLLPQLAAIGYTPANITYLALSHYHGDHVANANAFAATSTWLVQQVERDAMFAPRPANEKKGPGTPNGELYSALRNAKTMVIPNKDHDVFGDGTVVIKFTPGHTPGHQSLFLKLEDRPGAALGRPVSLPGRDEIGQGAFVRLRRGTNPQEPRCDEGVRGGDACPAVDSTRRHSGQKAQDRAGVLRITGVDYSSGANASSTLPPMPPVRAYPEPR